MNFNTKINVNYASHTILILILCGVYLIFSSEYINADGYEHIRRICDSQINNQNWFYYRAINYLNNIFIFDSCHYFNSFDQYYFGLNFYDLIKIDFPSHAVNLSKLIFGFLISFIIFMVINKNNKYFYIYLTIFTSPFFFFSLLSSSSDSLVCFFSFLIFLCIVKKNYFFAIILLIPTFFLTDKSSIYIFMALLFLVYSHYFKSNLFYYLIIFLIIKLLVELIKYNLDILNFDFVYNLNIANQINSTRDYGKFFLLAFPLTIFSTPNFKIINFFNLIYFLIIFIKFFKRHTVNDIQIFFSLFLPFFTIASLIGGVSMARHFPLFACMSIFIILYKLPKIYSIIPLFLNIFFILLVMIIYINI